MKNDEVLNSEREALLPLGVGRWALGVGRCLLWELGVGRWMLGVEPAAGVSRLALALPSSKPTHHFDAIALQRPPGFAVFAVTRVISNVPLSYVAS